VSFRRLNPWVFNAEDFCFSGPEGSILRIPINPPGQKQVECLNMKGDEKMIMPLPTPISIVRFVVAGVALGAGWKVGCFLVELASGEKSINWSPVRNLLRKPPEEERLWKRQFGKVSE